jgi:hypothetical protein
VLEIDRCGNYIKSGRGVCSEIYNYVCQVPRILHTKYGKNWNGEVKDGKQLQLQNIYIYITNMQV